MSTSAATTTLFLVPSANHAIQGEQALLQALIHCRLIPVPRRISSQCGVCLSVRRADRSRAEKVLQAAGTLVEGTYDVSLPPPRGG